MDPAWIALIGTVCGGIGLKVADHFLGRNNQKNTDAVQIRDELRARAVEQAEEIRLLEAEVEKWRKEYYDLRDQFIQVKTELMLALQKLKEDLDPPDPGSV